MAQPGPSAVQRWGASGERLRAAGAGVRIELVTVAWMLVEAIVGILSGLHAHSVLLVAFGLDSVIELVTGGVLLWRLRAEARSGPLERVEQAERQAAWVTGIGLALLCLYVVASAAVSLLAGSKAEASVVGLVVAGAAVVGMPVLAWRKRAIAARLNSAALRGDAACSMTCAYMAATLLGGLALTAAFGWWWADPVAAVALLVWLVPEAREALAAARARRGACCRDDDGCEG